MDGFHIQDDTDLKHLFSDQTTRKNIELPYLIENFERVHSVDLVKSVNYDALLGYSDQLSVNAFLSKFNVIEELAGTWTARPVLLRFWSDAKVKDTWSLKLKDPIFNYSNDSGLTFDFLASPNELIHLI